MSVVKEAQQKQEAAVHQHRLDEGVRAVRDWLVDRQGVIGARWTGLADRELYNMQGEAKLVAELLRVIDHGPRIKPVDGVNNG